MKVLITLGPTQEPIDAVRYVTNASSGKMGLALARESISRGHETAIISGPVGISLPSDAKIVRVRTAEEMINSTLNELENDYQILISTAAIADYSPEKIETGKIKSDEEELTIRLKPTQKLTRIARQKFPELFIVAFKAEYGVTRDELINRAVSKLESENLDMIVANDIKNNGFGSDSIEVYVIDKDGNEFYIPKSSKENVAGEIWDIINKNISE